ncbi:protein tyrosine phosphatase [Corynebacterium phocae]|uniref:protein-tyrosine-phosphatase n=1 Tax=Corynebacterium phocae TaxID=161895 RepID=A0A1L7D674_9CORY|nr:low molecular weight protein-tyrosine-phosphatase [Corynebacterium phocae]APT93648.1 protein tyrosine phosphatase [Corynebacterium phocae]KAA8725937.1 low molecular weight phosphotyrosine protein phosphatase [Corynebacterium phocae]
MTSTDQDSRLHIVFVCTGNICRSPMAEVIARDAMETDMLDLLARTSSCGLGGWHVGQGADERAIAELRKAGHDGSAHRAAQLGKEHMDADLFVAMDSGHRDKLIAKGIDASKVKLMRSFDEDASSPDVEDPYYGSQEDFATVRHNIEDSIPGLMDWIRDHAQGH